MGNISDDVLLDLKQKVTEVIASYPKGSIISNYLYELRDNSIVSLDQMFDIEI